jgi:hypothetical protein
VNREPRRTNGEEPAVISAVTALGSICYAWCPHCKAFTLATGPVYLLTPHGVSAVGSWAACEVCERTPNPGGAGGG